LVDWHNLPQFDKQSLSEEEIPSILGQVPFFEVSKDDDFFFNFFLPLENFFQLKPFQKNFFQGSLGVIIADPECLVQIFEFKFEGCQKILIS
jgi:hypothetical protein